MILRDGRVLDVHDSGRPGSAATTIVWHHGSPHTGNLIAPLLALAAERGIRLVACARPAYGGSTRLEGRSVAAAAADVEQLADELGMARFAVMGHSGGAPHALACAALLPDRVTAAVSISGLAPFGAPDLDWFEGMQGGGPALRAAAAGRHERERHEESAVFDAEQFSERDWAALAGAWKALGADAQLAEKAGPAGLIDDDLAFVAPWGFDPAAIGTPVLLVHGGRDRVVPHSHSGWLLGRLADGELWFRPRDGHISILDACPLAMDWLAHRGAPPLG